MPNVFPKLLLVVVGVGVAVVAGVLVDSALVLYPVPNAESSPGTLLVISGYDGVIISSGLAPELILVFDLSQGLGADIIY